MRNADKLSKTLDINFFYREFGDEFKSNLNSNLISTLSNMFALDYALRANEILQTKEKYISNAKKKLKIYLAYKYVEKVDFSTAMELFIVAISKEDTYSDSKTQDQVAEYIVDNVLDIPKSVIQDSKIFLKTALSCERAYILDLVNNNTSLLSEIVASDKSSEEKILDIKKAAREKYLGDIELEEKKSIYSMIGSSLVVAAGASASILLGGIAAFVVIPVSLASFQMGADAGEKFAKYFHKEVDDNKNTSYSVIDRLTRIFEQKVKGQEVEVEKIKVQDLKLDGHELDEIKNAISTIKNNLSQEDIKKSSLSGIGQKKQSQSRDI